MIFLRNDYSEGMHPNILEALIKTNHEQHGGYGEDAHSLNACELIRKRINKPNAAVHLLVGGTQTNRTAISAFLRSFEAVVATDLAHIAVHETGAIEASGHKIIEIPSANAKLTPEMIDKVVKVHNNEHMVKPKMVYISNSTELGTIYKKSELVEISKYCKTNNLYLYLDGARLSTALACENNDISLEEIADLCDVFYLGAAKNGAMFGEALIILNDELKSNMRYYIKQNGALLANARFLGIQFEELLKDDLFIEIAKNSNKMAKLLGDGLESLGFELVAEVETNMVFVIFSNDFSDKISKHCHFNSELARDGINIEARFVTSFATPKEDVEKLLKLIAEIKG